MKLIKLSENRYIKASEIVSVRLIDGTAEHAPMIRIRSNYMTWIQGYSNQEEAQQYFDNLFSVWRWTNND